MENGTEVKQQAYADDVCLISSSKDDINGLLRIIHEFSEWSGLSLNIRQCGCLSMINSSARGRYVEPFSPELVANSSLRCCGRTPTATWVLKWGGRDRGRQRS